MDWIYWSQEQPQGTALSQGIFEERPKKPAQVWAQKEAGTSLSWQHCFEDCEEVKNCMVELDVISKIMPQHNCYMIWNKDSTQGNRQLSVHITLWTGFLFFKQKADWGKSNINTFFR